LLSVCVKPIRQRVKTSNKVGEASRFARFEIVQNRDGSPSEAAPQTGEKKDLKFALGAAPIGRNGLAIESLKSKTTE
jgi:hypothetical protein